MSVLGVYTGGGGKSGLGWGSHLGVLQRWVQDWAGLGWGGAGVEERAAVSSPGLGQRMCSCPWIFQEWKRAPCSSALLPSTHFRKVDGAF